MKHKYIRYLEHVGEDDAEYYAMEAIVEFAEAGESIPGKLLPTLKKAGATYIGQLGNRVSNPVTEEQWIRKIAAVRIYIDSGFSVNKAIKRAAVVIDTPCKVSSMRTKYYDADRESLEVVVAMCDLLNEWEHQ